MRAAVLPAWGAPLEVRDVPEPELGTGEVIIDVLAARVLGYLGEVLSGQRGYLLDLPAIPGPGGVGRVRAVGPDATKLDVGDLVFCDSTVRARDDAIDPDMLLQGLSARGDGGLRLQHHHRDGSFAERMRTPTENVIPLGDVVPADAPRWCALGSLLVPYGGLLAGGLTAGETVVVNGATGDFGSAAVAVAVAMGAEVVVATGRNLEALALLERVHGDRARPVAMTGEEDRDRREIASAAGGPIDLVLDLLPPAATAPQVRAAVTAVRTNGRVVLMGGVPDELGLSYNWLMRNCITLRGQWMYPRHAVQTMIGMVRAGLVDLDRFELTTFALDDIADAVRHAAEHGGPYRSTLLLPNGGAGPT